MLNKRCCAALAVLLVAGCARTGSAQSSGADYPARLSGTLPPTAATATTPYVASPSWRIRPVYPGPVGGPGNPVMFPSQVVDCGSSIAPDACVGQFPWGSLLGGTAGVAAALVYCSGRSCDAAIFALMFLGGYIGSELGKFIQCGLPPLPLHSRPPA